MINKVPKVIQKQPTQATEVASSLMPFDESELFHNRGIIKGINLTTDSLVLIDQKALASHNEFIVGQTGMGKNFYIQGGKN